MAASKPDYGVDAPKVLRNLLFFGTVCLLLGFFLPARFRIGEVVFLLRPMFRFTGLFLLAEGLLYLQYVKFGKLRHRDFLLSLHSWRGDEAVLDVGCGRGLLLAGAAKRLTSGHATGIDIWSNEDMGGNSEAATRRNLELEGVSDRSTLLGIPAQEMPFADASFNVVVSNLCLHNIYDKSTREKGLGQIVRVLRPGGVLLLSDYKLTGEYATYFRSAGLVVRRVWGRPLYNFPPLRIVVARKPASAVPERNSID